MPEEPIAKEGVATNGCDNMAQPLPVAVPVAPKQFKASDQERKMARRRKRRIIRLTPADDKAMHGLAEGKITRFEAQHPRLAKKMLKQLAAGAPIAALSEEYDLSRNTIAAIRDRNLQWYEKARARVTRRWMKLQEAAVEHSIERLPDSSAFQSATIAGIAHDKVARVMEKTGDESHARGAMFQQNNVNLHLHGGAQMPDIESLAKSLAIIQKSGCVPVVEAEAVVVEADPKP